jgi:glycosyltransferase involved in cell wall biosynthesis
VFVHGLLDPAFEERLQRVAPAVFFAHGYYGVCISGEKTHKFPIAQPCGRRFGPPCLALYYPRRCGGLSPPTMVRDYMRQRRRLELLGRYDAVVTASEHMRAEFVRHGAAGGRVVTCPFPAVGPDGPAPGGARPRHADTRDGWHLVFAGRMDRLKGGDRLIDVLPAVHAAAGRPLEVTLAGDGPARADWERRARRAAAAHPAIDIRFTGWLQRPALDALLDRADLVVMPSLWPEPFGLTGVEANRRGVPVVAYATGGIPEWLTEGGNGCLAPADPPTHEGLTEAIVRCLAWLSAGRDLRVRARQAAAARSEAAHVAALLAVLRDAAQAPRGMRADRPA